MDVNPYEVLGVRPSAGSDEIELAFKGRRSQYHPDRYAQADAETRAWATEKMKEVNAAYQLLLSVDLRSKFDERMRATAGSSASRETPKEPTPIDMETALLKSKWSWDLENIYVRPSIPRKKFEGAREAYAPALTIDDVLILVDDTVFGGAREGMLVTKQGLFAHQKFEDNQFIRWDAVKSIDAGASRRIVVNNFEFFKADIVDHKVMVVLAARLSEALTETRIVAPAASSHSSNTGDASLERLMLLHRRSLTAVRSHLGDRTMLIDTLIDQQMMSLMRSGASISQTASMFPSQGSATREAELAEVMLGLFLALHWFSLSQLPDSFRRALGQDFSGFHEPSYAYKEAFVSRFREVFGHAVQRSEDDLMTMVLAFYHRDGEGPVELRLPRRMVLENMLTSLGLQPSEADALIQRFQDLAGAWVPKLYAYFANSD